MIESLVNGAHVLKSVNGWSQRFGQFGVDTSGLNQLVAVGTWVEQQLPALKRRFDLAQAMERNHPDSGRKMVQVPDNFLSLQEAQRRGKLLADRMNKVNRVDGSGAEEIHRIATELGQYQDDPEVLAAFYANLGPNRLTTLPTFLYESGSKTGKQDLQTFSRTLGTASSANYLATPGFDKVTQMMLRPSEYPFDAWGRLALMQYGHFPTEYIRTAAKNLALDKFAKDPDGTDWRGNSLPAAAALGLSEDNVALALNLLGKDGVAARDVLNGMHQGDYRKTYDLFLGYAKSRGSGDDVAAGLGKAIEAGSGVGTEKPGQHSLAASQFAFNAMTYMAGQGKDGTPWPMKTSMANLGASYIHELTTGSRGTDAEGHPSSMARPANWTDLPGITPAFYLSQDDTKKFLTTFSDSQPATDVFDTAAGQFSDQALRGAAKVDAKAVRAGKEDPGMLSRVSGAFGGLAKMQYEAELAAGKDMDAQAASIRGVFKDIVTLGLGELTIAKTALNYGWKGVKFAFGKHAGSWAAGDNPEQQRVTTEYQNYDRIQKYRMTQLLYESGYPVHPPPPKELLNADGSLKSLEQLQQDARNEAQGKDPNEVFRHKLKSLSDWSDSTAAADNDKFDNKAEDAAERAGGVAPTE
ncbi:hypothetical protein ITI46_20165 [Streptomyces oryzae]|uniref:Uncharacterized protein n=1 Tax=Streptomyces oryzae TaxID=1434886 RepID=A0ABS3XEZ7_9ACTN|nr:hypothetical protein [Streptomyces oryzae]MBO8193961.1 hypothetical protein [Streptomyces oryzae]